MHLAFYLEDSGRIGHNLHFKSDVKSGLNPQISHCAWMHADCYNCGLKSQTKPFVIEGIGSRTKQNIFISYLMQ